MQALAFSGGDVNTDEFDKKITESESFEFTKWNTHNEGLLSLEHENGFCYGFEKGAANAKALLAPEIELANTYREYQKVKEELNGWANLRCQLRKAAWFDKHRDVIFVSLFEKARALEVKEDVAALDEMPEEKE